MSNSEAQKIYLLAAYLEANKNKNQFIRLESSSKKEFLDFVGEEVSSTTIEVEGKNKTYTHGLLEKVDEVIDAKVLYDYMESLGLRDYFWDVVKPIKGEVANYLSKADIAKLTTIKTSTKIDIKESK